MVLNNPIKRRNKMRRLFVFLPLAIVLTLILAGCPAATPTTGTGTTTTEQATEAPTVATDLGEATAEMTGTPETEGVGDATGTPEAGMGDMTGTPETEGMGDMTGTPEAGMGDMTGTPEMEGTPEMTGTPEAGMGDMTGTPEMEGTPEMTGTPEAGGTTGGMAGMVNLTASAEHGEILTDGEGRTLYLFTQDAGGASTCSGDCATAWPPFTVEGEAMAGTGVDQALLGTITRDDGTTQVTYNGHPLYYYAEDINAGDTTGQGVGDVWYLVNAQGEQVE
jgi:predicted lipoprotein with Yx(FWY)xxD motif